MEIGILRGILFAMDTPTIILKQRGFKPVVSAENLESMQGRNVIVAEPANGTLHVVVPGTDCHEIFDFTKAEPKFYKTQGSMPFLTKKSLFKVAD